MSNKKVLFLLPYPLKKAPSQRFRVEAFFPVLTQQGIPFRAHCFLSQNAWQVLYKKGSALLKLSAVLSGFLSRFFVVLFVAHRYHYIFIHREAAPIAPPVFEWILAKLLRKKLIYDFDDAIWIPAVSQTNRLAAVAKCCWKVKYICKWAYQVAAGNDYLAAYARNFNRSVTVLPTCVDTETRFNRLQQQEAAKVVIGWTGSHSTLPYLDAVVPVLAQLQQHFDFEFLVICNQPPAFRLPNMRFIPWQEATEIDDLLQMHIGIMPLEADAWSEGKCGFKIIQYLALGIPAVASPVGVNNAIIQHGTNGFLCATTAEWYAQLSILLKSMGLRQHMGLLGRTLVQQQYSISVHAGTFLSLLGVSPATPFGHALSTKDGAAA